MKEYKWMLLIGSRKVVCPQCGRKTLVPYVLTSDNRTEAGSEFGRCDRESKCGYHRYPRGERMVECKPIEVKPTNPIRFSGSVVSVSKQGNLYDYATKLISANCSPFDGKDLTDDAWTRYRVGAMADGSAIFWQIDKAGNVRSGKWMQYGKDGHRIKIDGRQTIGWMHKLPSVAERISGEDLEQCFFGEHLLDTRPNDKVIVVESEKTAVVMSALAPQAVWLACGGAQNLKNTKRNEVLKGREVMLLPDNGKCLEWSHIAERNGWECNLMCRQRIDGIDDGYDILDIIENKTQRYEI